jgi:C1A family cysteine protease
MQQWANWTYKLNVVLAGLSCMAATVPTAYAQDMNQLFQVKNRSVFSTGFLPADPEKYQALPTAPRTRAILPPSKDLSDRFPTPAHQGDQNSCSAFAVGYAARSYYLGRESGGDWRGGENMASPAYIYNTLNKTGNCQVQVAIYDAIELLKNQGAVPVTAMPYKDDSCAAQVTASLLAQHAPRFRVLGHTRVEKDQASIKSQIANNNPVIFAMHLTEEFFTWDKSFFSSTQKNGKSHAMVITGYDDKRQAYKFINSWGNEWGEGGFGWLTYQAASALWIEGYTLTVGAAKAATPQSPLAAAGQQ